MKLSWITAGFILAALCQWLSPAAYAQEEGVSRTTSSRGVVTNQDKAGQFGVGLQAGSLSGITADYWTDSSDAIAGALTAERGNVALTLNHLWMFPGAFTGTRTNRVANYFVPYIGAGGLAVLGNNSDYLNRNSENIAIGAQVPLGVEFLPSMQRFGVYGEVAPSLEVLPIVTGFLTADLGARFYF